MTFLRRTVSLALASLPLVLLPASALAGAGVHTPSYPAPAPLPAAAPETLPLRYQATQRAVAEALAVAQAGADQPRASALLPLLDRNLLEFDPRGGGRVVEVIGDLAGAERLVIVVPGSHTTLDTFNRPRGPGGSARALAEEISAIDPAARVATVAWLGYDPPQGFSHRAATVELAIEGAEALRASVARLRAVNPHAPISLLCHSYGSLVCAYAALHLQIADLAVYGSPGLAVRTAAQLSTVDRLWAGRATGDWIRFVPSVRLAGLGFGPDPVAPAFGARIFAAGEGAHGDYHLAGSVPLRSLALIALGIAAEPATDAAVRHG